MQLLKPKLKRFMKKCIILVYEVFPVCEKQLLSKIKNKKILSSITKSEVNIKEIKPFTIECNNSAIQVSSSCLKLMLKINSSTIATATYNNQANIKI